MSNNNNIFTTIIGVAGLVGIGYGYACHSKMVKVSERLDKSIDGLANDMEIDISEELVNKAVNKAVMAAVKSAVDKATNEAVIEVRNDVRREVAAAVNKEYEAIKESVLKEITVASSKIDVDKVRKDVERGAEKMALEKFDANLENVAKHFYEKLDTTAKVCSMFAATPGTNREFVVKLG